jgi:hypothetical protein
MLTAVRGIFFGFFIALFLEETSLARSSKGSQHQAALGRALILYFCVLLEVKSFNKSFIQ